VRVAHDAAVGDLAEGGECLAQGFRLNLGAEVAHEYVVVRADVCLGLIAGTGGPVHLKE